MTVNGSLQRGRSGQLCRIKTSCLRADVCVELEPGEVGPVEVGGDDAVSSSPLIKNEQGCHQMPQIPFQIGCSPPRFDFWPKLRSGRDNSRFPAHNKANPDVEVAECTALFDDGERFTCVMPFRHGPSVVFPFCGNLQDSLDGLVDDQTIITFFPRRLVGSPPRRTPVVSLLDLALGGTPCCSLPSALPWTLGQCALSLKSSTTLESRLRQSSRRRCRSSLECSKLLRKARCFWTSVAWLS